MAKKKGTKSAAKAKGFKIGKTEGVAIGAVVVLILGFMFFSGSPPEEDVPYVPSVGAKDLIEKSGEMIVDEEIRERLDEVISEFEVKAYKYAYNPQSIRVKNNTVVMISLSSLDVEHSFVIEEFYVDVTVPARETTEMVFFVDKVGTFEYSCGSHCPVGAHNMKGSLVVVP